MDSLNRISENMDVRNFFEKSKQNFDCGLINKKDIFSDQTEANPEDVIFRELIQRRLKYPETLHLF